MSVNTYELWTDWRQKRDADAFAALVRPEMRHALAAARRTGCDDASSEDALQEALIALARETSDAPVKIGVRTWLMRQTRDRARSALRSRRRRTDRESIAAKRERCDVAQEPPSDRALRSEELEEALALIDAGDRELLLLRYLHSLEYREMAAYIGISPAAARVRVHRALDRLRKRVGGATGASIAALPLPVVPRESAAIETAVSASETPPPSGSTAAASQFAKGLSALGSSAAASIATTGVLVMLKKLIAVAAVLLILLGGWAFVRGDGEAPRDTVGARDAPEPTERESAGRHAASGTDAESPDAGVPVVEADALTGTITVRVTSEDGNPISDALVTTHAEAAVIFDLLPPTSEHAQRTDSRGRVDLAIDADSRLAVVVQAHGFSPTILERLRSGADVEVVLRPSVPLSGRVIGDGGVPVSGARVRVVGFMGLGRVERQTTTDSAGEFSVEWGLSPASHVRSAAVYSSGQVGGRVGVGVRADGYATSFIYLIPGEDPRSRRARVTLVRGENVRGRVLDASTGAPIAGAVVSVWRLAGRANRHISRSGYAVDSPLARWPLATVKTADDGTFVVPHVTPIRRPGMGLKQAGLRPSLQIGAWIAGYAASVLDLPPLDPAESESLELRLVPAGTVEGRVTDPDGIPVPGAWVWFRSDEHELAARQFPTELSGVPSTGASTDHDGRFHLAGVPLDVPGSITAVLPVSEETVSAGSIAASKLTVESGRSTPAVELVLRLPEGLWAQFRVTDESGSPIWGVGLSSSKYGFGVAGETDRDGRGSFYFGLSSAEGVEMTVHIGARGYAPTSVVVTASSATPPRIDVTLGPGHEVSGIVLDTERRPVKGATVIVADGSLPVTTVFPGIDGSKATTPALPIALPSIANERGQFAFEDLPPGPFHLRATGPARRAAPPQAVHESVPAGTADVVLVLPPAGSPGVAISVRVVDDETGAPVETAWTFLERSRTRLAGVSSGEGVAVVEHVPQGRWTLRVWKDGYRTSAPVAVDVTSVRTNDRIEVRLRRGATVSGVVTLPSGTREGEFTVELRPRSRTGVPITLLRTQVDGRGRYTLKGVPPGAYELRVYRLNATAGNFVHWRDELGTPLVPRDDDQIVVTAGAETIVRDVDVFEVAGILDVRPADERLPRPFVWAGTGAAESDAFGRGTTVEVRNGFGQLVATQWGVSRGYAGVATSLVVLPGEYSVRLTFPGEAPVEVTAIVRPNALTIVRFAP